MKKIAFLLLYLMTISCTNVQDTKHAEPNQKYRDFMTRIKAALVILSKTTPVLQGIESVPIQQPKNAALDQDAWLEFTRNVQIIDRDPPPTAPVQPASTVTYGQIPARLDHTPAGTKMVINADGIDLYVAVRNGWPHREITKAFESSKDPTGLKFYYYIGTSPKESGAALESEKKAIQAVLNSFGAEFLDMTKVTSK